MTDREQAFQAMRNGSLPGMERGSSIYGIGTNTMNATELRIALDWALSQAARLLGPDGVGIKKKRKQ